MAHEGGRALGWLSRTVVRRCGLVTLAWVLIAIVLNMAVPQLEKVVAGSGVPMLPDSAPAMAAFAEMDKQFGGNGTRGVVFVAVEHESGITDADRRYYGDLATRLRAMPYVTAVQDVVSRPELTKALASEDGKSLVSMVSLTGAAGSAAAIDQLREVKAQAQQGRPAGTLVEVTGTPATIIDLQTMVDHSLLVITLLTIGLISLILLVMYRSVVIAAVVLLTIGVALGAARAITAFFGLHVFTLSPFTGSFLTAIVLGAGTDYSVFLIGRMRELLAQGAEPLDAAIASTRQISGVIAGSALTVAVTTGFMALAELGIFWTTGPAIALSILITLAVAITLSPALLAMAAARGFVRPAAPPTEGRWARIAGLVVRRPLPVLLVGLLLLLSIGSFYPRLRTNLDQSVMQPSWTDSNRGYALIGRHFDLNTMNPDFILIQADHDLRNAQDLAAIERAAGNVAAVPGVRVVRTVSRPLGSTIEEASLGYQAGEVGKRLDEASDKIADGANQTDRLTEGGRQLAGGAGQLANGAGQLASGAQQAIGGADRLLQGLNEEYAGLGKAVDGSGQASDAARQLAAGAGQLADGLEAGLGQAQLAVDGLGLAYNALAADPVCTLDPVCNSARAGIKQIWDGERDQLLPGMRQAAAGARKIADGNAQLADGVGDLKSGLAKAREGIVQLSDGQRLFKSKMGELAGGAGRLAGGAGQLQGGADQIAAGTGQFAGSVQELQAGLAKAAEFLLTTGKEAHDPKVGGFYLPANALADPKFALASGFFMSQDGRSVRMMITEDSPLASRDAMERAGVMTEAVRRGFHDTPLTAASVRGAGLPSINANIDDMSNRDFARMATFGLIGVLLILMFLLRSLIAPLYLLASVLLSFATTMGIGVLVWQDLLGRDVDWTVQPIAFIILVAVGADYNLLLMSRIQQEAPDGSRDGIRRALTATGGVITSAGVIFAASMFALIAGDALTMSQVGFMIGVGLLLDTFVVRTLVVPAVAVLLGKWNWWSPFKAGGERAASGNRGTRRIPAAVARRFRRPAPGPGSG
ncbi:RND family transporter [Pseudonocardiaceae bacterium YIM PH 21723]|nr:RND family transporter [Pseudonocardiaceae bacterium YIM PH 21723]